MYTKNGRKKKNTKIGRKKLTEKFIHRIHLLQRLSVIALDLEQNFFFGNDCYFIVGKHVEYLFLVLNSTLLGYLFRYYIYSFDETGFKIFTDYFQNIRIPTPNEEMANVVQKLIKENANIEEVNKWVYSLFNFTNDEVLEIENSINVILENGR